MKQGEPQASLRAQWNDHAELRVGAKRKNAFPSRPLAANRQICKRSGRFVGKPEVCQRSELVKKVFLTSWWTGEQAPPPLPHPQFAMVAPLRSQARLRLSLAYWAYYGLLPPLAAAFVRPYQFPLKSYGFSGAETARKRFCSGKWDFPPQKSPRPRRTRRRGRLKRERASVLQFGMVVPHRPSAIPRPSFAIGFPASIISCFRARGNP